RGLRRADGRPAKRRFLPEKETGYPTNFVTPTLPGVTTHVLGPPTDPALRQHKKVPSSWGFEDVLTGIHVQAIDSPFSTEWRVSRDRLPPRLPFINRTLQSIRLFNDDLLYAAKALDGFLNGESLVLVLEIGSARLLLPGDAEV